MLQLSLTFKDLCADGSPSSERAVREKHLYLFFFQLFSYLGKVMSVQHVHKRDKLSQSSFLKAVQKQKNNNIYSVINSCKMLS